MRILIIEDDNKLRQMLCEALGSSYLCDSASTFTEAIGQIEGYNYNGILLDRNLSCTRDAIELIAMIKKQNPSTAIIIASAYSGVEERLAGLVAGADDYIEKPYDLRELKMRLDLLVRRNLPKSIKVDRLEFDLEDRVVTYDEVVVNLTKKESDLLFFLLSSPNKIFTREDIANAIYLDPLSVSSNTIDVTMKNLRKKLIYNPIETIKGQGYVFRDI